MTCTRTPEGVCLTCSSCGERSETQRTARAARIWGRDNGWSRLYPGCGEMFRCPACRDLYRWGNPGVRRDVAVMVPFDLHQDVAALAVATGRTVTDIITEALRAVTP